MTADVQVFFDGLLTEPRLDHAECLAVHPDGSIWCGGERGQIFRVQDGKIEQVASTDGFCLGLAFDAAANLYVCDLAHAAVFRLDAVTGELTRFADGAAGRRFVGPNFAAIDGAGRIYVTDNGVAGTPGPGVFAFDASGVGELWHAGPFDFANGLALSADDRTLYVAETWARRILAVPVGADGSADTPRVVVELPGMLPDGLAVDRSGQLYVGCYEPSRIVRVDPTAGTWETVAEDPDGHLLCHPTNLAFHGELLLAANLGRWHLSSVHVGDIGLPLAPFRGR
jgi:sugar lactone lactonase YvrE